MRRTVLFATVVCGVSCVLARSTQTDFASAATEARRNFESKKGSDHALQFVRTNAKQFIAATTACKAHHSEPTLFYDVVFIVSRDGQIVQTIPGPINSFGRCMVSHLTAPSHVAKPPRDSWAMQVRFQNTPLVPKPPFLPFPVVAAHED